MKALIDKYSTYFILALVLVFGISVYLLWVRSKGTGFGRYAYNDADKAAFDKIIEWVRLNNPNEYSWWRENIKLYMPGGARANMFGLDVPDMPDGRVSLTKRVLAAMNEMPFSRDSATGYSQGQAKDIANIYYGLFKTTV